MRTRCLDGIRTSALAAAASAALACIGCEAPSDAGLSVQPVGAATQPAPNRLEQLARTDHAALLEHCLQRCRARYHRYTCTVVKQERLGGRLRRVQHVDVKFLDKPFSVAMVWTKNAGPAERLLYVEGKYGGNMLVRPSSPLARLLAGQSVQRRPDDKEARKNSLRTIDQFGFENGLKSLLEFYRLGKADGVLKEEFGGYAKLAGRTALVLVRYLSDDPKYPCYLTRTYIDVEHLVPICVEGFDSKDRLVCRYVYRDVDFAAPLTEKDFTPEANGMAPPK